jgi:hypothetical protein
MPTRWLPMQTLPAKPTLRDRRLRRSHSRYDAMRLRWHLKRSAVTRASASERLADGGASRQRAPVGWARGTGLMLCK